MAPATPRPPAAVPVVDADASLLFVINAASGHTDAGATRSAIETALRDAGRRGELLFSAPGELAGTARSAAAAVAASGSVLVAVGGDGTINAVAQAAYAQGCAFGIVPQGTFNYFARTHGIPTETAEASLHALLRGVVTPVQVGLVNDRVFLVNASLGLYPELLQDREAYKSRFGRSRGVAFLALFATLLTRQSQLRIRIELAGGERDVTTPTLFVGNNRLQLEQVGLPEAPALDAGRMAAVMSKPIGTLSMLGLLLQGALGRLGEADAVESFEFRRMVIKPRRGLGRQRSLKVAFDGEVGRLPVPLEFRVAPQPLYLLKPPPEPAAGGA